jgi:hypothetical protein
MRGYSRARERQEDIPGDLREYRFLRNMVLSWGRI